MIHNSSVQTILNRIVPIAFLILAICLSLVAEPSKPGVSLAYLWNNSDATAAQTIRYLSSESYLGSDRKVFLIDSDSYNGNQWMDADQWQRVQSANLPLGRDSLHRLDAGKFSFAGGQINEIIVPEIRDANRFNALSFAPFANFIVVRTSTKVTDDFEATSHVQKAYNQFRSQLKRHLIDGTESEIGLKGMLVRPTRSVDSAKWNVEIVSVMDSTKWQAYIQESICSLEKRIPFCHNNFIGQLYPSQGVSSEAKLDAKNKLVKIRLEPGVPNYGKFYLHWDPRQEGCPFMVSDQVIWSSSRILSFYLPDTSMLNRILRCDYILTVTR
jgi:hypothetical protein